tara:strand:+ start:64 stop:696 length:633 start_codon:yes stop_codon:yes gene_type:complete
MISKLIKEEGILANLLEKGIKILVKNQCKKTGEIQIDIIANSIQIIKGIIPKIYLIAKDINYKDLLFDEIELEANDVKVIFEIKNKKLNFNNNFIIKFKISLSENSLKTVLLSKNWNWIWDMISKEILNQEKLEDIEIKNGQLLIKALKDNRYINEVENVDIKAKDGSLYLENKSYNKSIKIPIEDKICIKDVYIKNNLINIFAKSTISF